MGGPGLISHASVCGQRQAQLKRAPCRTCPLDAHTLVLTSKYFPLLTTLRVCGAVAVSVTVQIRKVSVCVALKSTVCLVLHQISRLCFYATGRVIKTTIEDRRTALGYFTEVVRCACFFSNKYCICPWVCHTSLRPGPGREWGWGPVGAGFKREVVRCVSSNWYHRRGLRLFVA